MTETSFAASLKATRGIWVRAQLGLLFFFSGSAQAQHYYDDESAYGSTGPTAFQKIMTGDFATLIMILVGSAGLFLLFFSSEKGSESDKRQMHGMLCIFLVIGMCWYRFSLWNDPAFAGK